MASRAANFWMISCGSMEGLAELSGPLPSSQLVAWAASGRALKIARAMAITLHETKVRIFMIGWDSPSELDAAHPLCVVEIQLTFPLLQAYYSHQTRA